MDSFFYYSICFFLVSHHPSRKQLLRSLIRFWRLSLINSVLPSWTTFLPCCSLLFECFFDYFWLIFPHFFIASSLLPFLHAFLFTTCYLLCRLSCLLPWYFSWFHLWQVFITLFHTCFFKLFPNSWNTFMPSFLLLCRETYLITFILHSSLVDCFFLSVLSWLDVRYWLNTFFHLIATFAFFPIMFLSTVFEYTSIVRCYFFHTLSVLVFCYLSGILFPYSLILFLRTFCQVPCNFTLLLSL